MLTRLESPVAGAVGVEVSGLLRHEDYVQLEEWVVKAAGEDSKTNLLVRMGPLKGWTPHAALDDARFGLFRANRELRRLAVVTDRGWIRVCLRLADPFIRYEMKHFAPEQIEEAWRWVGERPNSAAA